MKIFPHTEFSDVSISSNSPAYINTAQSLKTIAASTGAQRFEFELTTAWHNMATARALSAFLNAVGQHEPFELQVPLVDMANGTVTGTVKASSAYAVGTTDVVLANFSAAIGDFLQFISHSKVYQVADVNGSTVILYPPLIKSVALNELVNVNNLKFTVRNKGDISALKSKKNNKAKLKLKIIEAF
jgi:hypothetical protein